VTQTLLSAQLTILNQIQQLSTYQMLVHTAYTNPCLPVSIRVALQHNVLRGAATNLKRVCMHTRTLNII
jgi:hypothetical protein